MDLGIEWLVSMVGVIYKRVMPVEDEMPGRLEVCAVGKGWRWCQICMIGR